jgi:hypothetical protein
VGYTDDGAWVTKGVVEIGGERVEYAWVQHSPEYEGPADTTLEIHLKWPDGSVLRAHYVGSASVSAENDRRQHDSVEWVSPERDSASVFFSDVESLVTAWVVWMDDDDDTGYGIAEGDPDPL